MQRRPPGRDGAILIVHRDPGRYKHFVTLGRSVLGSDIGGYDIGGYGLNGYGLSGYATPHLSGSGHRGDDGYDEGLYDDGHFDDGIYGDGPREDEPREDGPREDGTDDDGMPPTVGAEQEGGIYWPKDGGACIATRTPAGRPSSLGWLPSPTPWLKMVRVLHVAGRTSFPFRCDGGL